MLGFCKFQTWGSLFYHFYCFFLYDSMYFLWLLISSIWRWPIMYVSSPLICRLMYPTVKKGIIIWKFQRHLKFNMTKKQLSNFPQWLSLVFSVLMAAASNQLGKEQRMFWKDNWTWWTIAGSAAFTTWWEWNVGYRQLKRVNKNSRYRMFFKKFDAKNWEKMRLELKSCEVN